jgi:hypothetical protein
MMKMTMELMFRPSFERLTTQLQQSRVTSESQIRQIQLILRSSPFLELRKSPAFLMFSAPMFLVLQPYSQTAKMSSLHSPGRAMLAPRARLAQLAQLERQVHRAKLDLPDQQALRESKARQDLLVQLEPRETRAQLALKARLDRLAQQALKEK